MLPGKKSISFRLKKWTLYSIIICVAGFCLLSLTLFYFSFNNHFRHSQFKKLREQTDTQQNEIKTIHSDLNDVKNQLENILEKEEELRVLLGDVKISRKKRRRLKRLKKRKIKKLAYAFKKIEAQTLTEKQKVIKKIEILNQEIKKTQDEYTAILDKAQRYKTRFASTPSIRPLYGRILSKFGWRHHPIHKRKKFHKGIDIAAWIGAPIQSTADGLVEYAGWSGTFGYVVVIDHDFGYRTIYAHCSQLLCKKNELVKKGQIIAQVGNTGLSTGPHLHYEIRKWRQAVSPQPYLDLDMFTASSKIW